MRLSCALLRRCPKRRHDGQFVMIGEGPLGMHLENRSSQLRLTEKVLWLGDRTSVYNALDNPLSLIRQG